MMYYIMTCADKASIRCENSTGSQLSGRSNNTSVEPTAVATPAFRLMVSIVSSLDRTNKASNSKDQVDVRKDSRSAIPLFSSGTTRSHSAIRRKASVNRHDDAGDESRSWGKQPQRRADQVLRFTKAPHRRVRDDGLPTRRQLASLVISEQKPVLRCDEKTGGESIDADLRGILFRQVDRQPSGKSGDPGLGAAIGWDATEGAEGTLRSKVENDTRTLLRHQLARYLARQYRTHHIQVED